MNFISNFILCGALIIFISISSCKSGKENVFRESGIAMGTTVEITIGDASETRARSAIHDAMAELNRIEALMGHSTPTSEVSVLNREGSERKVTVSKELFSLLRDASAIAAASGGAFDVTILPVVELWGFEHGGSVPDHESIAVSLGKVGYRKLIFDEKTLSVGFKAPGMRVDLGAIAKGWAVDKAMEKIIARGVQNAIVDAGGDLRVLGARPGKDSWRIGVQHPRQSGALLVTFDLRETAIVTSGDYERFFTAGGERYHHILDPATGLPARGCQSVTVLAPTAAEADACATAAFVLGPEKGLAFLRARPGVRGLIVDAAGGLHWTDAALARLAGR